MRIVYASLLLSLSACMIIGDPKDPNESASATSTSGPDGTSTGTSTGTTGGSTDATGEGTDATGAGTASTSSGTSTTEPAPTTGVATTTGGPACADLDEAACAMDPGCSAHHGAPHVVQDDMLCADYDNLVFLACDEVHPPCPPAVVTVCPIGQPDTAFDVASGCIPPGYETCMEGPIAECP